MAQKSKNNPKVPNLSTEKMKKGRKNMADGRWQLDLDLFPNQFRLTAIRQKVLQMGGAFALAITRRNLRHNYATNFLCPDSTFFLGIVQKGPKSAKSITQ